MVNLKELPIEQLAAILKMSQYEAVKHVQAWEKGEIPVVFKSPKREERKAEVIKKIVENLPCTLSIFHKRTGISKTNLKLYLNKLIDAEAITRECDMYFLCKEISPKLTIRNKFNQVLDKWYLLDEYKTPSFNDPCPRNSVVKLLSNGKKIDEGKRTRSEQEAIKRFNKAHPNQKPWELF